MMDKPSVVETQHDDSVQKGGEDKAVRDDAGFIDRADLRINDVLLGRGKLLRVSLPG
jgi:hypothetical protein